MDEYTPPNPPPTTLGELTAKLDAATLVVFEADKAEIAARKEATAARNTCNDIQKQVDAKMAEMRLKAPRGSDWHNDANRKSCVERAV